MAQIDSTLPEQERTAEIRTLLAKPPPDDLRVLTWTLALKIHEIYWG